MPKVAAHWADWAKDIHGAASGQSAIFSQIDDYYFKLLDAAGANNNSWQEFIWTFGVIVPLRNIAQVVFCNNALSGLFIIVGIYVDSPWQGTLGVIGALVACFGAMCGRIDRTFVKLGLAGYNSVLFGLSMGLFLDNGEWAWKTFAGVVFVACLLPFLSLAVAQFSTMPSFTYGANLAITAILAHVQPLAPKPGPTEPPPETFGFQEFPESVANGISQIFFVKTWIGGLLMILGVAAHRPKLAAHMVIGSIIGTFTALVLDMDAGVIRLGLTGYNAALTAEAMHIFFGATNETLLLSFVACILTQVFGRGMATAFGSAFHIPVLTLPFCFTVTLCLKLKGRFPSIADKPPEGKEVKKRKKRAGDVDWDKDVNNELEEVTDKWSNMYIPEGITEFACICGYTCGTRKALKKHMKRFGEHPDHKVLVGTNDNPATNQYIPMKISEYACICGFMCGTRPALIKHLAKYPDDNTHRCVIPGEKKTATTAGKTKTTSTTDKLDDKAAVGVVPGEETVRFADDVTLSV